MATFYIKHLTEYTYNNTVIDAANQIKLYPINDDFQKTVHQKITVNTNPYIDTYLDFYNNLVGTFMIVEPHYILSIESDIEVVTKKRPLPEDKAKPSVQWDELKSLQKDTLFIDFLNHIAFNGTQDVLDWINSKDLDQITPYQLTLNICNYIYTNFKYLKGVTTINTTLDEVWHLKAGVCQDFTNIMMQITRMLGIPTRYVSGYICPHEGGTRGEGATHAWIEAYIPFYGWLGFDPTNNEVANENHVRLAVGRDYHDCSPVKGVFKGNVKDDLFVNVKVTTAKENIKPFEHVNPFGNIEEINSFRKNQEIIQHQQQQQQ